MTGIPAVEAVEALQHGFQAIVCQKIPDASLFPETPQLSAEVHSQVHVSSQLRSYRRAHRLQLHTRPSPKHLAQMERLQIAIL